MTGFLAELGSKLADRWVQLLIVPGLLWSATTVMAWRLSQQHPFSIRRLLTGLNELSSRPAAHSTAAIIVTAVALVLVSATAALLADATGRLFRMLWGAPGNTAPLSWVTRWRRHRWNCVREQARTAIGRTTNPAPSGGRFIKAVIRQRARHAERRRVRRPAHPPTRPTRIAERFQLTANRVSAMYGLRVETVWPRLWTLLPDNARRDVATAQDAYAAAARLAGWGLLYALLAVTWWPAAVVGTVLLITAMTRARATATALADLLDAATDLYLPDLARKLDLPPDFPTTAAMGAAIWPRLGIRPPSPADPAEHASPQNDGA